MTVSYTDKSGSVPARVKMGVPWPVDPRQYPLSGPTRGPVYAPEPKPRWRILGWPLP